MYIICIHFQTVREERDRQAEQEREREGVRERLKDRETLCFGFRA